MQRRGNSYADGDGDALLVVVVAAVGDAVVVAAAGDAVVVVVVVAADSPTHPCPCHSAKARHKSRHVRTRTNLPHGMMLWGERRNNHPC